MRGHPLLQVRRALDDAHNVVAFREEGDPVIQSALLLIAEILPFWLHVRAVRRRLRQRTRSILPDKNWGAG